MSKRLDACTPRKNGDRTFWLKVGSAWQNEKGIQVVLDALPIPDAEGRCVINLFEPRENNQRADGSVSNSRNQSQNRQSSADKEVYNSNSGWSADDLNDDIAF